MTIKKHVIHCVLVNKKILGGRDEFHKNLTRGFIAACGAKVSHDPPYSEDGYAGKYNFAESWEFGISNSFLFSDEVFCEDCSKDPEVQLHLLRYSTVERT